MLRLKKQVGAAINRTALFIRKPSADKRVNPSFIIIGAQRSGTTYFYDRLTTHPQIGRSLQKEVHFFDYQFQKGVDWYRAHFPVKDENTNLISGEGSPYYLYHPLSAQRVRDMFPEVKVISLLRNPVSRAYSHHQLQLKRNLETLPFEEALEAEEQRLEGEEERLIADENYYSFEHHHRSYLTRGCYAQQLKRWTELFPQEQLLTIKSEDFYASPETELNKTVQFLELSGVVPENGKEKVRLKKQSYPKMDPETQKRLTEYYRPFNQELHDLVGIDWEEKAAA